MTWQTCWIFYSQSVACPPHFPYFYYWTLHLRVLFFFFFFYLLYLFVNLLRISFCSLLSYYLQITFCLWHFSVFFVNIPAKKVKKKGDRKKQLCKTFDGKQRHMKKECMNIISGIVVPLSCFRMFFCLRWVLISEGCTFVCRTVEWSG